jgi:radial spoke head protein 4A
MSSFEEAKQYLQKESAGTNLYDHLSEVILKLVQEKPQDARELFETVSAAAKDTAFSVKDEIEGESLPGQGEVPESKAAQTSWAESSAVLFKTPEGFDDQEQKVQDWASDSAMLEWAGVSFGDTESYRISLALKHLAASSGASDLRLWGKISGTKADYYIAEGNTDEGVEKADKNTMDFYDCAAVAGGGYRIGANAHSYWVCSNAGGEWTKLPDVTCQQIVVSRALRKIFTGDLEAPVYGYPPFPGQEKNYLRAIIARISSDSVIVPDGVFTPGLPDGVDAEDESGLMIMANEEMSSEPVPVEEVADPSTWVHMELGLNKIGRATPFPVDPDKEEEEENPDAELAGAALRVVGEEEGFEEVYIKKVCNQFAVIRNLKWPGAYTAANQKSYVNIYVGSGVEYSKKPYIPQLPPKVQSEWKPNEEELPGDDEPSYCGAVLKFHAEDAIQFDPHTQEEVDDE